MLISHHRSPDRPRTDQHTAFDARRVESRRKLIRYALIIASAKTRKANIYSRVSLPSKPGFQAFLTFESEAVRTKPYPHDYSSKPIRETVVQRLCQFASVHGTGKSLKVKDEEENAAGTRLERTFGREDLDVSVKASPCAVGKPESLIYGPLPRHLLRIENRADGRFCCKCVVMDTEMLRETDA